MLFVTTHFPPSRAAGTHRMLRFVRDLDLWNWNVSVLTLTASAYRDSIPVDELLLREVPTGVEVVRTGVSGRRPRQEARAAPVPAAVREAAPAGRRLAGRRERGLKRFWRDLWSTPDQELAWWWPGVRAGMRLVDDGRVDVIVSSAPPFTCHLIAAEMARRSRRPWVADFRDPWSRAPWGLEWRNQGWTGWVHRRLERLTIGRATRVVLNTERMQEDFADHYDAATGAKFLTISNGFDSEVLDRTVRPVAAAAPSHTLVICHAGSLYQARDPRPLLGALASLRGAGGLPSDAFRLQLVGGGGGEFGTRAEVVRLGLTDVVEVVPPVSHGESLGYLRAADVLLVIQPDTLVQVPVKLYEYLWARRPILALASDGAVADIVRDGGVGLVVQAHDEVAIAGALRTLYERRQTLAVEYAAEESFLRRFEGRVLSEQLHDVLFELATTAGGRQA